MPVHKNFHGIKGRSGRKSKPLEFKIHLLKELAIARAIKALQDERENKTIAERKDSVMLKMIDKAVAAKQEITGENGNPIRIIFRAAGTTPNNFDTAPG